MPWEMHWVPLATDLSLPVLAEPPDGYREWNSFADYRIFKGDNPGQWVYECHLCGGWIESCPAEHQEDTIGPLCGRSGTVYSCVRCGHEIGFSGMMS